MIILDAESLRNSKLTFCFIFINIFCFFFFNLIFPEDFFFLLIQINFKIINNLEIWRLFSAIFLHADVMHLFSNMIALLFFGAAVENHFSKFEFLVIYLISGLIGNLFSLILLPLYSMSLGASGAIFGLIGAAFIMIATEDRSLLFIGFIYITYFVLTSLSPGINLWAHLTGLAGGLLLGFLFNRKYQIERRFS
ncbi:MAG: rhomboid family intramembrane serine protease [Promethearchaeota archaeon]